MDKKKLSEEEFQAHWEALNGMERAEPAPFFYTRLRARMEKEESSVWGGFAQLLTRPALVMAAIGLILIMNIFFIYQSVRKSPEGSDAGMAVLTTEYSGAHNPYYDFSDSDNDK